METTTAEPDHSGATRTKVIVGLGNPGPEYDGTRHNVGWWVLDRYAYDQDFESFERKGKAFESVGVVDGMVMRLLKPRTYMNRSGQALTTLWQTEGFDVTEDLLVVADDATLDVGRVRFRPAGGSGGHNGLKSVESALGTKDYARLRVGVGQPPAGMDMTDWVLGPPSEEEEDGITSLLPELSRSIDVWAREGVDVAMNQFNR